MASERNRFETFLDGVCEIWGLDDIGIQSRIYQNIRFQNRITGSRKHFDALLAGHSIQKVIRVPLAALPHPELLVLIGGQQYHCTQNQQLLDTVPRCVQLTLEDAPMLYSINQTVTLISVADKDILSSQEPEETETDIVCTVRTIQASDMDDAGLTGLSTYLQIAVPASCYHGESLARWNGKRYAIANRYQIRSDVIELRLEERAGVA